MRRVAVIGMMLLGACGSREQPVTDPADALSGGTTTVYDATALAYSERAANLSSDHGTPFTLGHALFETNWVTAPATTSDIDGLGPLFNARSCSTCHAHDGRAAPLDDSGALLNLLVRVSVAGTDAHGGPLGDAVYGTQLRTNAILGIAPDCDVGVSYSETTGAYGDGTPYSLRAPSYAITSYNYGTPPALLTSARVGPSLIGLGLLEAIDEQAILANAGRVGDPDGVVGSANAVWDAATSTTVLGRFGWKANVGSVLSQIAGALQQDMGITSAIAPDTSCTPSQTACRAATNGGTPEIDSDRLAAIALYMRTLAVPARRDLESTRQGEQLFTQMGCATCHVTTFVTGTLDGVDEVAQQTIHPYTDLLLHDMGAGLADERPDYDATGSQWRTPPLWGIGLLQKVNGHQNLLHDGRARGFAEAILWHDGEASAARERFRNATAAERAALTDFLESL